MTGVAVVIPTRDRREMLLRAVASACAQRGVAVEVVVVDDGSTDGSAEAVAERFGQRVRVIRHPQSRGVSAARNTGIAATSAEWVSFLDDDDVWAPDKLVSQVDAAERTGRGWAYVGMVSVDARLRVLHGVPPDPPEVLVSWLPVRNRLPAGPSNVLVRRAVLDAVGLFDPGLRYHADWDLWVRVAQTGPPAVVDRPLLAYVLHADNMALAGMLAEVDVIERRYAHLRKGRPIDRGLVYRWLASQHLRTGRYGDAARTYARAVAAAPWTSSSLGLLSLLHPRIGRATAYRPPADPRWRAQAECWLVPLREENARALEST